MQIQNIMPSLLFFLLLLCFNVYSQENANKHGVKHIMVKVGEKLESVTTKGVKRVLKEQCRVSSTGSLEISKHDTKNNTDFLGIRHERYKQFVNGVNVEKTDIRFHYRNDSLILITGQYVDVPENFNTKPVVTKQNAIETAISHIGAQRYRWEIDEENLSLQERTHTKDTSYYPGAELTICLNRLDRTDSTLHLAYKINVFAIEPMSNDYVYVDARTGDVIGVKSRMRSTQGSADTRYSGTRSIETTSSNGLYILKDAGRKIQTRSMKNLTYLDNPSDFGDFDNNWSSAEFHNANKDDAALDVHWGMSKAYDYFNTMFDWDGFDGNNEEDINCYVHWGNNFTNSRWNGDEFLFGDGNESSDLYPYVSIDVVAHEYGHAVCEHTAELEYEKEPGALCEGLSDIWGICVKQWATPEKNKWVYGDELGISGELIPEHMRNFSDPMSLGQPDTYGAIPWETTKCDPDEDNDYCSVHHNSGVIDYWFYLLVNGGKDVNGKDTLYNVTGIGIDAAARIVFYAEKNYMGDETNFNQARNFTFTAALVLYGTRSQESVSVLNAWNAVGVGGRYECVSTLSNETITTNTTIVGCDELTVQNVSVQGNVNLVIDTKNEVLLQSNVSVPLGSTFEIRFMQ